HDRGDLEDRDHDFPFASAARCTVDASMNCARKSITARIWGMSVQDRKQRARMEREQLIVSTAREIAEREGWDAVTTRRLAERIEYSQPVLYSHFRGRREIVGAVALEGSAELAAAVRTAAAGAATPHDRVAALARAYLDFATRNPAVYDAIFQLDGGLAFAQEDTPAPLKDAFAALQENIEGVSGENTSSALLT